MQELPIHHRNNYHFLEHKTRPHLVTFLPRRIRPFYCNRLDGYSIPAPPHRLGRTQIPIVLVAVEHTVNPVRPLAVEPVVSKRVRGRKMVPLPRVALTLRTQVGILAISIVVVRGQLREHNRIQAVKTIRIVTRTVSQDESSEESTQVSKTFANGEWQTTSGTGTAAGSSDSSNSESKQGTYWYGNGDWDLQTTPEGNYNLSRVSGTISGSQSSAQHTDYTTAGTWNTSTLRWDTTGSLSGSARESFQFQSSGSGSYRYLQDDLPDLSWGTITMYRAVVVQLRNRDQAQVPITAIGRPSGRVEKVAPRKVGS